MKSKTIKQAAARCRAAWRTHPNAIVAWCCHHQTRIEALICPAEDRIKYILRSKPPHEQIVRLDNFRPVDLARFPSLNALARKMRLINRRSTQQKAAIDRALKRLNAAQLAHDKICDELRATRKTLRKRLYDVSDNQVRAAHLKDVPTHDWSESGKYLAGTSKW